MATVRVLSGYNRFGTVSASASAYNRLVQLLQRARLAKNPTIVVNADGETPAWSEAQVAQFVLSGGVYVDFLGWPFYYSGVAGGNFGNFLHDLGITLGADHAVQLLYSIPGQDFYFNLTRYSWWNQYQTVIPYPYGLATTTNLARKGMVVAKGYATTLPLLPPVYVYNMFYLRAGRGYYFYAYHNGDAGVPVEGYANYIVQVLGRQAVSPSSQPAESTRRVVTTVRPVPQVSLREGATGPLVVLLQRALIAHGFGVGPAGADGIWGPDTQTAVLTFQRANVGRTNPYGRIVVDGVVGPANWYALGVFTSTTPSVPAATVATTGHQTRQAAVNQKAATTAKTKTISTTGATPEPATKPGILESIVDPLAKALHVPPQDVEIVGGLAVGAAILLALTGGGGK